MPTDPKTVRLQARISTDLQSMIRRAAALDGRTVNEFVATAVHEAAQRAIAEAGVVIGLSQADQACVAHALLSPPPPSLALIKGFERRRKLLRPN